MVDKIIRLYNNVEEVIKKGDLYMQCPKCQSSNVNVQAISTINKKNHGCLYWLLIGWWLEAIMWLFLTLPWLIVKIFKPKKYKSRVHSEAVCQNCGYHWKV